MLSTIFQMNKWYIYCVCVERDGYMESLEVVLNIYYTLALLRLAFSGSVSVVAGAAL